MSVNSVIGCLSSLKARSLSRSYGLTILPNGYPDEKPDFPSTSSHPHEIATNPCQLSDRALQVVELSDEGRPTIRNVVCAALGVEQTAVARHFQSGAEHLPRHRLLGDAMLERPLPAQAQTPLEQFLFVDAATGAEVHQLLGHDPIGVDERPEHQMGHQQVAFIQAPGGLFG